MAPLHQVHHFIIGPYWRPPFSASGRPLWHRVGIWEHVHRHFAVAALFVARNAAWLLPPGLVFSVCGNILGRPGGLRLELAWLDRAETPR